VEEPEDEVLRLETDGKYVAIDVQNKINPEKGEMSFITKSGYSGIKRIAFNAKTGTVVSWWGIALSTSPEEANVYNTDLIVGRTATSGIWTTFIYEFDEMGCTIQATHVGYPERRVTKYEKVPYTQEGTYYLHFVAPRGEEFSEYVCLDNFTIELLDGTRYIDGFDEGADTGLFRADEAVAYVQEDWAMRPLPDQDETPLTETNEVYYESEDKIDFTAYAPITVENWGGSWTKNPNLITDEQYRYLAEAGFTKSLALYEGRSGDSGLTSNEKAEKDALLALEYAEKYGIEYYVLNELFYNFVRADINLEFFDLTKEGGTYYNASGEEVAWYDAYKYLKSNWMELYKGKMSKMFDENTAYIDSPAYGGNFASDEPPLPVFENGEWYYGELEQLYYQLILYNQYMEENSLYGGEAYVNLLPYESLNADNRARYDAMLEYYFKNIAPILGYVCYDQYPLNNYNYASVSATHLLNLEMMANYCKEYDTELRTFLWSKTTETGHRAVIGANDLRFQAYAALAFGAKEMPYYTYFNYYANGSETGCDSLIDCHTGERTPLYYWAKEVNNEIHSFEDAYLNFKWESSMYFDAGTKNQQFSLLETSLSSHERLTEIQANADILVGVFSDEDGKNGATDGFVVMNYSDPYYAAKDKSDNVVISFAEATHVLVYKDGKQYVAELTNGELSVYLEAGEGMFVVPFQA
jgi:hypothetical protein